MTGTLALIGGGEFELTEDLDRELIGPRQCRDGTDPADR